VFFTVYATFICVDGTKHTPLLVIHTQQDANINKNYLIKFHFIAAVAYDEKKSLITQRSLVVMRHLLEILRKDRGRLA
jgi:hypothetical protein